MLITVTLLLGFLVFIHEGGHYLAAACVQSARQRIHDRPAGAHLSASRHGETTLWHHSRCSLGGYATHLRYGTAQQTSPHLKPCFGDTLYRQGHRVHGRRGARPVSLTEEEALQACLKSWCDWGSLKRPASQKDKHNAYRATEVIPSKKQIRAVLEAEPAPKRYAEG